MAAQEIVGAIIDSEQITNDMATILRSGACGRHVEYISRRRAATVASFRGGDQYAELAKSPTLFLVEGGVRFYNRRAAATPSG